MYQLVLHKLLIYKGFLDFKKEKTAEGLPLPLIVLPIERPVLLRVRAGTDARRAGDVAGAVGVVLDELVVDVDQMFVEPADQHRIVFRLGRIHVSDQFGDPSRDLGHLLGLELHMRDRARGADGAVELRLGGKAVADDIR